MTNAIQMADVSRPEVKTRLDAFEEHFKSDTIYQKLKVIAQAEDAGASAWIDVIETDTALAMKMLYFINSTFFGKAQKSPSLTHAAKRMHALVFRATALFVKVHALAQKHPIRRFSLDSFQHYCMRIAHYSEKFIKDSAQTDLAFASGLLHDIGKPVLMLCEPELFSEVVHRVAKTRERMHQVESELLNTNHSQVGAGLLQRWGFPPEMVATVLFLHAPRDNQDKSIQTLLLAVHAADTIYGQIYCNEPNDRLDAAFLESTGATSDVSAWKQYVKSDARLS